MLITKRIPTKWFNSVSSALDSAQSQQELFDIVMAIKQQFGFISMGYGVVQPKYFQHEIYYLTSDEPHAWKQAYVENEYWKRDTRLIIARQNMMPFRWSQIDRPPDSILNELLDETLDGVTIPVHGPNQLFGVLHFTFCCTQKKNRNWLDYISPFIAQLAQHIILSYIALILKEQISIGPPPRLSKAQRTCLTWAAEGKTTEEIAIILTISISTVNKHLDAASILLNAHNRTQAIAKAVDRNLIGLAYKKKAKVFYI